jgi:hypothetical protein
MMEPDAAPAGGARNPALGRPRDPQSSQACADCVNLSARGTMTPPRGASLDWDWSIASSQEARTRGQKSPRWSAAGRARLAQRRARASHSADLRWAPSGAWSPRIVRGEKRRPASAGQVTAPPRRKKQGRWRAPAREPLHRLHHVSRPPSITGTHTIKFSPRSIWPCRRTKFC